MPFHIHADDVTGFDYTNYYQLNYLQSSGNNYIDSGIVNNYYKHFYQVKFNQLPSSNTIYIGSSASNRAQPLFLNSAGNIGFAYGGTNRLSGVIVNTTDIYTIRADILSNSQGFWLNDTKYIDRTDSLQYQFAKNIAIFGTNQNNTFISAPSMQLYYYYIMDSNGSYVAKFYPAERKSDGKLGLYNTITGTFVYGSGTWTSGGRLVTQYTISTSVSPSNSGSVSGGGTYDSGATVTLTATASSGYRFSSWSTGETTPTITFVATSNLSITAYFEEDSQPPTPETYYTISTIASPTDGGTVSGGGSYVSGTSVTLTATPNNGYVFDRWTTGSTNSTITVVANSNTTYTAYFVAETPPPTPTQYTITTSVSPSNTGSVSGGGMYDSGTTVTLLATSNTGYNFSSWSDGVTANPRQVTVTSDLNLVAYFEPTMNYDVVVGSNINIIYYEYESYVQNLYSNDFGIGYIQYIGDDLSNPGELYRITYNLESVQTKSYLYQVDVVLNDDYIGYVTVKGSIFSNNGRRVYVNGNHFSFTVILNYDTLTTVTLTYNVSYLYRKISADTIIIEGDSDSQSSVSDFESQLSDFNDTTSEYQSMENDFNSDFESSMNDIDIGSNGLNAMGSNFQNSAVWVATQFNKFTNNTPFGSVLGFSLVLGLSLLIIGRVFK